ncbi:MAG TPA: glycosyltransferase family 4 protein [Longimicrobiaceae bacterium]|nr:glycosyltransferase family 4 protein [Longimicrobiaceae bacterium]
MRVVVSCGSRNWGGLERMAELLARGLGRRGHDVVLFCRRDSPLHRTLASEVPCEPILGGGDLHPRTVWRCARALDRHRAEIVLANTVKDPRWTGVAARLKGIPVVYRQEIDEPYPNSPLHRLVYGWVPARHVVNSEATRGTVLRSAAWVRPEEVVVIPNGVDLEALRSAAPAELGLPDGAVLFGFVGRWEERKGIRELAGAWRRVAEALPRAHLAIVGWGAMEQEFRGWLEGAPNVRWLGFRDDVPSVMAAMDVLVAPSHYEGFGLVVVEAMAVGTAVIGARASSIPELVDERVEGVLVPPKDPAALAEAMIELGGDAGLRERMGAAGRARAERDFSLERMLDRHEALFEDVLRSRAGRR